MNRSSFTAQEYRLAAEVVGTWQEMDSVRVTPRILLLIATALEAAADHTIDAEARDRVNTLSPKQRRVFEAIAAGASNKDVARQLGCAVKTVESHRAELARRLHVRGTAALVNVAYAAGVRPLFTLPEAAE